MRPLGWYGVPASGFHPFNAQSRCGLASGHGPIPFVAVWPTKLSIPHKEYEYVASFCHHVQTWGRHQIPPPAYMQHVHTYFHEYVSQLSASLKILFLIHLGGSETPFGQSLPLRLLARPFSEVSYLKFSICRRYTCLSHSSITCARLAPSVLCKCEHEASHLPSSTGSTPQPTHLDSSLVVFAPIRLLDQSDSTVINKTKLSCSLWSVQAPAHLFIQWSD